MVIRGKSRGDGRQLAYYLLSTRENDKVKVLEIRGTAHRDNLVKAIQEMEYTTELTNGDKGLFHAQLNPGIGEDKLVSLKDWLRMADIAEEEYGLKGQKRAIVQHEKNGRLHCHVVWERYDHDKGILKSDSYTHYKGCNARERIEQELGLRKTPWRNKEKGENIKKVLSPIWNKTKTAEGFINKAREMGFETVTSQNRRPFMVVDETGRSYDLSRATKAKTQELRDRFKHTKLKTDKEVIREILSKQAEKQFNFIQEKAMDKMDEHKMKTEGKQSEKKLQSRLSKAEDMKQNLKPDKEAQKAAFKEAAKKALDKDDGRER